MLKFTNRYHWNNFFVLTIHKRPSFSITIIEIHSHYIYLLPKWSKLHMTKNEKNPTLQRPPNNYNHDYPLRKVFLTFQRRPHRGTPTTRGRPCSPRTSCFLQPKSRSLPRMSSCIPETVSLPMREFQWRPKLYGETS
jgi:hypothetical protein